MQRFWQDIRYGARVLLKTPAFTGIAVLTLALGIGANTAIFSAVNAVLLRPLPYLYADRLALLWETYPALGNLQVAYPDYVDWRRQTQASGHTAFDDLAGYTFRGLQKENLTGDGEPEQLRATLVSTNLLSVVGVQPMLGRNFLAGEEVPGHDRVVLVSHSLWMRRLGGDASALHRSVQLNGESFRVVGVLPAGRSFPAWADVLLPISHLEASEQTNRKHHQVEVVGRLKPGATLAQAQAEIAGIAQRLARAYPATNNTIGARLVPLQEQLTAEARQPLLVLLCVASLILLIACANVANLILARGAVRQKEVMIRAALGAAPSRLIRQLLTESILLAAAGGVLGLLLATWAAPLLRSLAPNSTSTQIASYDARVLGFTLLVALLSGALFGLLPAWKSSRTDLNTFLRDGRAVNGGSTRPGLRTALVAGEVALAIVVLVAAGLLIRSFSALLHVDPGFRADHVLTLHFSLPATKYVKDAQVTGFYQSLLPKLAALPGVESVASITPLPFTSALSRTRFAVAGKPLPEAGRYPIAQVRTITPGYFRTLKIPLRRGRYFTDADMNKDVLILNESLARKYFPDQDPLGRRVLLGVLDPKPVGMPVVGVVGDTRELGLNTDAEPELYFPGYSSDATLVLRTAGDPLALAPAARQGVLAADREQPVDQVRSMDQVLAGSLESRRVAVVLLALFSGLGLVLAAVGLYGVISYSVTQRTREMGLRRALGADRWDILRLVLQQGIAAIGIGVALGIAIALSISRLLRSLLYQVSPVDPVTYLIAPVLLAAVALAAIYIPARRAARVDPMIALRWE